MKKVKLKNKYPITCFEYANEQLIKDQIDSRTKEIEILKKEKWSVDGEITSEDKIKFHKNAIKELEDMKKEFNN